MAVKAYVRFQYQTHSLVTQLVALLCIFHRDSVSVKVYKSINRKRNVCLAKGNICFSIHV